MDPEMKTLLTVLLDKVERIEAKLVGSPHAVSLEHEKLTTDVARLGGRIDQLALDVALSRRT